MTTLSKFTIDMDDMADLKKHITILQKRRKKLLGTECNYEPINFGVSRLNNKDIMNIFEFLLKIEHPNHGTLGEYYVYVHANPTRALSITRDIRELFLASKYSLTHIPFYVGKGNDNRCFDLNRNEGHRKVRTKILLAGKDIQVTKVIENLTKSEALFEEQKLIAFLGLSSLNTAGLLVNLQTDMKIIECFRETFTNNFITKEERLKEKGFKLINLMENWIR